MSAILTGQGLREVMRHVPSPVTIVTFIGPDGAKGITIGSFTSVSLDPPLISFNVMHESSMHDVLANTDSYAVQILSEEQGALSEKFAIPNQTSQQQFDGVMYSFEGDEIPVLDNVLAVLRCRPFKVVSAGDHSLFIGEVIEINSKSLGKPLLYYKQSYRKVGSEV